MRDRVYFLFAVLSLIMPSASAAADKSSLLDAVRVNEFLMAGNVDIVDVAGSKFLVSVGVARVSQDNPKTKLNAMRSSRLRSHEGIAKLIFGSKVSSVEKLQTIVVSQKDNSGKVSRRIDEVFVTELRERSHGVLPPNIDVGDWLGIDQQYYWVSAIEFD